MKADNLRKAFLDFFKSKNHRIVESDSLVPKDDPTVLFTPAGMNQFKKEFLGYVSDYTRAATSQRCLRTDDLDKVGKTSSHHTLFEMLGNFSFGDYFKEDAIAWAWEFLTGILKIKKELLWVSVYKDDDEAYHIWLKKVQVPSQKIVRLGDKDNFWPSDAKEKGPNGPCGPCSEIFYDWGEDVGCRKTECSPACSCGRFTEIWNLVFTQFNRKEGGILEPLPQRNIDTGMGLERLTALMQGAANNFETDLFIPLIRCVEQAIPDKKEGAKKIIYAVVDHVRAVVFAIYDGVLPSNEGRGYVVRKLIRKSHLHLRSLGVTGPFLYTMVPVVAQIMKDPYPELEGRREGISEVILSEEKNFIATLESSQALFESKFKEFSRAQNPEKVGMIAFQLYDTYGVPYDLTKEWLDIQGIQILRDAFDKELEGQKNRSKSGSSMKGDVFDVKDVDLEVKETEFTGYKAIETQAHILKILKDTTEVEHIGASDGEASVILDSTVFYAESGGQVGDTGVLEYAGGVFEITDTVQLGKVIVHRGRIKEGALKKSDTVVAKIDTERRLATARNHTATHLLQAALRKVLGVHVQQQGSLVTPERLRFDFTHFKDIKADELLRVEETANMYILNNYSLDTSVMPLSEAKKSGALAFFADKYADQVRVVSIGDFSKEFCGGTHLRATGQIGILKIVHEGSIASGVRRIEAVTGTAAYKRVREEAGTISEIAEVLNVPRDTIIAELKKKQQRLKDLEKQLSVQRLELLKASLDSLIQGQELIKGIRVITQIIDNADMELLRKAMDLIKQKTDNAVIMLGTVNNSRPLLVMGLTQDLRDKGMDASKMIGEIAAVVGGSGGGRKDFAQAGGTNPENVPQAFEKLKAAP